METPAATTRLPPSDTAAGKLRSAFVFLGAVFILYGLVGAVILPPVAKKVIASQLGEKLGRAVEIDRVSVNPYTLEATVHGARIFEADRKTPFIAFDRLDVNGSVTSLTRFAPVVDEMTLDGLKVRLVRDGENHYNASDILARLAVPPKPKGDEPARFSVSNILISHARVDFDDRPVGAKHQVTDIDIAIPFVSNLPRDLKEFVQPRLSAVVNGSPLHIRGETHPFEDSLRTHVALQLDNVDLPRYVGYSPQKLPVSLDSGKLDGRIEVQFTQAQKGKEPAVVVKGGLAFRDLAMSTPGRELAKLALIQVDGINVDLLRKDVRVESLAVKGGTLSAARRADGSLDLPVMTAAADSQAAAAKPWQVVLAKATIDDVQVSLADEAVKPAATHRASLVHVEAMNLSSDRTVKPDFAARVALEKGGTVEVKSTVAFEPLAIDATVDARGIDLVPYRPYVEHFQTVKLKSGLASAKGHMEVREGKAGGLKMAYAGSAEVSRLATFDTASKEDLLNWESVRADRVAFHWAADEPLDVAVSDINVVKAYSRVVVEPDGRINLQQLKFATNENPAPAPEPKENPRARSVRIDRVKFVDSRLNFTDHYIKPNYTADVGALNGTVTGLSSDPSSRAKVDLKGSYDKSGDVVIAGTVNPLSGDLFLDIAAKGSDIELPPLSAYSLRYAGYPIKEGRLTLDVKYHVEDGKLDGHNKILLDHLAFGDKVEGPDATTLPVLFAVNLLKDENGRIDLELPIQGSLEDPQFDMGALIGQVVSNLLKKAVTAPFSLLAAAFGGGGGDSSKASGGEDLKYVAFAPGSAEGADAERAKLERISKALLSRPALKIEMAPHVDPEMDLAALRKAALRAKLAPKGGQIDDVQYAALVRAAYEKEVGKPKEKEEAPTLELMEARLMQGDALGDDALAALSAQRAEWVRGYLTAEGKLPADRVMVARAGAAEVGTKVSRVDFTLK
jgi:uncharacterized protein involved in outer membrane biogenesis